jgi:putative NADH-flavin reductase
MKKIVVFGANGRTGKYIVQYALEAGHQVTAFVHKHTSEITHSNLSIVQGDVQDKELVSRTIQGHDVVISVIGTNQIEGDAVNLMSDAMKIFVEAMNQHGIKRVLAVGGLAVLQFNETMQMIDKPDYSPVYKNVGEGHNKVYKVLRETNLDWTFIGCPDIIDGPRTGIYNVKKDYPAEGQFQIFTGDLADFIVTEVSINHYLKTRVGIATPLNLP